MIIKRFGLFAPLALVLGACGGGSNSAPSLAGNYAGTFTAAGLANRDSGTVLISLMAGSSSEPFKATLQVTAPTAQTIVFTGTITQAQSVSQKFLALESGGPYSGQTLNAAYNNGVPTASQTTLYIYQPGSTTQYAFKLVFSKSS